MRAQIITNWLISQVDRYNRTSSIGSISKSISLAQNRFLQFFVYLEIVSYLLRYLELQQAVND